ncbi:hypothetical protein IAQ61_003359 [Plenodomus lingam]|uniref:Similar to BCS1-like ATPase n=1 Tax=Leptosphaeria maculans (strain JN3 / isolate v23.1.3 / race Av1-4-5-6-7-8) TaxID=985895 RepID=E5AE97_LEPMJ|nr:similar to BCS1-like ATPase [Plenodomus lingam JN3]KAH9875894.1 hypothetical protein IAQ61_003359 [Plenodomus lingam]CBY01536.1 similar to BCS1-like ATPase [Plenodomus lingam JN3]
MDFSLLKHIAFNSSSSNGTLTLPSTILEAFIPGYQIFSQLFLQIFGFDMGLIISGCLIVFAISKGICLLYYEGYKFFGSYLSSTVYLEEYEDLYSFFVEWLNAEGFVTTGRTLKAVSAAPSFYQKKYADEGVDAYGICNCADWESNVAVRFEPWYGVYKFYFQGRLFIMTRIPGDRRKGEDSHITIRCAGRSYEPIAALLQHARLLSRSKGMDMTFVFHSKYLQSEFRWQQQSYRPARPLSTISLDEQSKVRIVKDINEYLHPATSRWYSERGIPYRRGYLLHGPPGTGKTSMSFALAGVFGMNIYCISLSAAQLTESSLMDNFNSLPDRCIVLLEDVDAAGLRREDLPAEPVAVEQESASTKESDRPGAHPTKSNESKSQPKKESTSRISLSGLLNVIDGAGSQEGRVLIMTTNCPESLDDALIRPGRVDLQIGFGYANYEQTRDIFTRMYNTENHNNPSTSKHKSSGPANQAARLPRDKAKLARLGGEHFLEMVTYQPTLEVAEPGNLADMARSFAVQIPEGKFSPAEIQGFLLTLKYEPLKAVEKVGEWRDALLGAKKKGKKVVDFD